MKLVTKRFDKDNKPPPSAALGALKELRKVLRQPSGPYELRNQRRPECFFDEAGNLGPYLRWVIALEVLFDLVEDPAKPVREREHSSFILSRLKEGLPAAEAVSLTEEFGTRFAQKGCARQPGQYLDGPVFRQLIGRLNELLKGTRHKPILWEKLLQVEARVDATSHATVDCLDRFKQWIVHGFLPPADNMTGLACEVYLHDADSPRDRRHAQLKRIETALHLSGQDRPIINIHSRDNATGLRACATELLVRLASTRAQKEPRALVYVRLSRSGAAGDLPSARPVVRLLNSVFSIEQDDDTRWSDDGVDWAHDLLALRQALTLHACTIVFDGVSNTHGPLSSLFDLIRNTHWDEMLRILAQPDAKMLRSGHRTFRSRFVVLSSEPIESLKEWCAIPFKLEPPSRDAPMSKLLLNPEEFDHRVQSAKSILKAQASAAGLREIYGLKREHFELIEQVAGRRPLYGESELAIVSMFKLDQLPQMPIGGATGSTPSDWRSDLLELRLSQLRKKDPMGVLAISFIAASISGMRLSTLWRCMRQLVALVSPHLSTDDANRMRRAFERFMLPAAAENDTSSASLAERYPALIVSGVDESMSGVLPRHRRFELQALPDAGDEPADEDASVAFFEIRHEEVRALLVAQMIANDREDRPFMQRAEWRLVNWILSEESLRQSTVLQRNAGPWNSDNPYQHRRAVQAIYHSLMSYPYELHPVEEGINWTVPPEFALPVEPLKRFRFTYSFLYRRGVEAAPAWMLSRGHARPRLKLAILSVFASPAWAVKVLAAASRVASDVDADAVFIAIDAPFRERSLVSSRSWIYRDPTLHLDIVEGLARAALDSGRPALMQRLVRTIDSELRALQPSLWSRAEDSAEVQLRAEVHGRSFNKLLIDEKLAANQPEAAMALCCMELYSLDLETSKLEEIMGAPEELTATLPWRTGSKQMLDAKLQRLTNALLRRDWSRGERILVADILSRVGELLAIEADNLPLKGRDAPGRVAARGAFLRSYAVYFVADRIRSGPDDMVDALSWPLVSSRPMRYYVRVALKLAKLTSENAAKGQADDEQRAFYVHARVRMDVLSRHLHQLPRERVSMLLLEAAAARVWAELVDDAQQSEQALKVSLSYIDAAETAAFSIGYPRPVIYRLIFERIKTLGRIADLPSAAEDERHAEHLQQLVSIDLDLLSRLCRGNAFWQDLVDKFHARRRKRPVPRRQTSGNDVFSPASVLKPVVEGKTRLGPRR